MVPFGARRRGRPWRGLSSRQWSFFEQRLARTRPHPLDADSHTTRPRIGSEQMSRAASIRFPIQPRMVGPEKVARRVGVTLATFEAKRAELERQGFPAPDPVL